MDFFLDFKTFLRVLLAADRAGIAYTFTARPAESGRIELHCEELRATIHIYDPARPGVNPLTFLVDRPALPQEN